MLNAELNFFTSAFLIPTSAFKGWADAVKKSDQANGRISISQLNALLRLHS